MTRSTILRFALVLPLGGCAVLVAQEGERAAVTLQAAIAKETIQGDIKAAIPLYEQALHEAGANRAIAARALLGLAQAQEKDGRLPEARLNYERIVREFGDNAQLLAIAQARLGAMPVGRTGAALPQKPPFEILDTGFVADPFSIVRVSPDGKLVALPDPTHTKLLIHTMPAGPERILVDEGATIESSFAWSPDSKSIAFYSRDVSKQTVELHIVTVPTGAIRSIDATSGGLSFDSLSWSPDGRWLAFTRARLRDSEGPCSYAARIAGPAPAPCAWDVRVVSRSGGDQAQLGTTETSVTPGGSDSLFEWAPDAKRLAFVETHNNGAVGIAVVDVATTHHQLIPIEGGPVQIRGWTKAGDVCYQRGASIVFAPASGGASKRLTLVNGDTWIGLTADAASVVIQKGDTKQLSLKNIVDGTERRVTTGAGQEVHAMVSPDGRLMSFASNRDGKWALYLVALDRTPESNPLRVVALGGVPTGAAAAPSGQWSASGLLIQAFAYIETTLYRLPIDPATERPIGPLQRLTVSSPTNAHPTISPDSGRVAFVSGNGSNSGFDIIDVDGTHEHVVVDAHRETKLRWRSNDQIVLSEGSDNFGFGPPFVMFDVKTGVKQQPVMLPIESPDALVDWAFRPGHDEILYVTGTAKPTSTDGPFTFRLHSLASGADRVITTRDRVDRVGKVLTVSPDGDHVAYAAGGVVQVLDLSSPDVRQSLAPTSSRIRLALAWSPTNRHVLACSAIGACEVVSVEVPDAAPVRLPLTNPSGDPSTRWLDADWSADGSFLVLMANEARSEWHALTGLTYDGLAKARGPK